MKTSPLWILAGHRGCGKSTLARSLIRRRPEWQLLDLDTEIEKDLGMCIDEIFSRHGEEFFRQQEVRVLEERLREHSSTTRVIVLGAGFCLEKIFTWPKESRRVWVRRETDALGRIFLDRPRLDSTVDPLQEFLERFPRREAAYRHWAQDILTLREGASEDSSAEDFFLEAWNSLGGCLTLESRHDQVSLAQFLKRGIERFEIRDDLSTEGERAFWCEQLPARNILWSLRTAGSVRLPNLAEEAWIDWDTDLGACPDVLRQRITVLSSHERLQGESLSVFLRRLEQQAKGARIQLKAAPRVKNLKELLEGHRWQQEDPAWRSFLPRSEEGSGARWTWYRLLMKGRMPLNFWREGPAPITADQPTLLQWMNTPSRVQTWAAVLGWPVHHSWTPYEQQKFFQSRGQACWAVPLFEAEVLNGDWEVLRELGLRQAAVTAPLKKTFFGSLNPSRATERACRWHSINTLHWNEQKKNWYADNTDLEGLQAAFALMNEAQSEVVVWGGGGTRPLLKELFPQAAFYSARTGVCLEGPASLRPQGLVWATGQPGAACPEGWAPQWVFDLNYFEHSPGRAYALQTGARYFSGAAMFRAQAAAQRRFWSEVENDPEKFPDRV